jgi:hypothetical protein
MANAFYPSALEKFLSGGLDLTSLTIKAALVDTGTYTFSSAHDFYDDVSAGVIGTPVTLASKTVTAGVFDAADATFTGVSGATVEAVVIYNDTGTPGTSDLICYIDTGTGFPLTPDGGNIDLSFDAGANKIFKIG